VRTDEQHRRVRGQPVLQVPVLDDVLERPIVLGNERPLGPFALDQDDAGEHLLGRSIAEFQVTVDAGFASMRIPDKRHLTNAARDQRNRRVADHLRVADLLSFHRHTYLNSVAISAAIASQSSRTRPTGPRAFRSLSRGPTERS
jgi:hypothetical protein